MPTDLKAYVVRGNDEGCCAVIFATNGATARRKGANELNLEFEDVESCRREPSFDQYAPGPVPLRAQLAAGWWFECFHCGCRFDQNELDEEDREPALDPVRDARHGYFCNPTCMMQRWAERRKHEAQVNAVVEACAMTFQGATSISAYVRKSKWIAYFHVPGVRNGVEWEPGSNHVNLSGSDAEAFQAWKQAQGAA